MARKILNFKLELEKIENERKRNIMTKQLENDYSSIVAKQQILFSVFDYIMENSEHRSEEYIISQEELKEAFIK
jgi:hypothetical protein